MSKWSHLTKGNNDSTRQHKIANKKPRAKNGLLILEYC